MEGLQGRVCQGLEELKLTVGSGWGGDFREVGVFDFWFS